MIPILPIPPIAAQPQTKRAPPIDTDTPAWDNPTMSTAKVDSKKRIVLPNGEPGDVFDIQQQAEGRLLLVRLERTAPPPRMNREECIQAMHKTPLRQTLSWEELRGLTREL